ncbi:MAG: (d)CMP kinase [Chitinophagales bacterium]
MQSGRLIAIDGVASSGKSTLAKQLANAVHFEYIDSGAFYRAVTYFFISRNLNWNKEEIVKATLPNIHLDFHYDEKTDKCSTFLNRKDIESEIRTLEVSKGASEMSAIPSVREFVTNQLRKLAVNKNVVMDGRDIGTVVFPNAELKIFLVASAQTRSERRLKELHQRGENVTKTQIEKNLSGRDLRDSTRSAAPLKKAEDAIELDNTKMSEAEQLNFVLQLVKKKFDSSIKLYRNESND